MEKLRQILTSSVLAAALLAGLCGMACAADRPSDTMDGITIELYGMRFEKTGVSVVIPDVVIRNESDSDIMEVYYEMTFFDRNGENIGSKKMFYLDEIPIPMGESVESSNSRFVVELSEKAEQAEIAITGYKTTEEMPPIHIPQEGEYLYQAMDCENLNELPDKMPVEVTVNIDQMGYQRRATFTEGNGLEEAVEAFLKIKIGPDDAPMVTDNYNWFLFKWEDGTGYMIRLNLDAMEYNVYGREHSYYLEDAEDFWRLAYSNLEDAKY